MTAKLKKGSRSINFCLKDANENEICLDNFKGKNIVLYFYPKDNTPGCTTEAMDFSLLKKDFENENAVILGISKDSCKSHQNFIEKRGLTLTLLSDPDSEVQKKYGVWRPKKFMGKEFLGTVRSTFLIGPDKKILRIWDPVKVKGHAEDVLQKLREINKSELTKQCV